MLRDAVELLGLVVSALLGVTVCYLVTRLLLRAIRQPPSTGLTRSRTMQAFCVPLMVAGAGASAAAVVLAGAGVLATAVAAVVGAAVGYVAARVAVGLAAQAPSTDSEGPRKGVWAFVAALATVGVAGFALALVMRASG